MGSRSGPAALPRSPAIRPVARICRAANRKAAEVVTKYIITDMYAKAIQGMPAEEAVKWAHDEAGKVYA